MLKFILTIGLFLGLVMASYAIGVNIGQNTPLLVGYIIFSFVVCYAIPIVMAFFKRQVRLLWIAPLAMVAFLIPSSMVGYLGCQAGNTEAIWAMRTFLPLTIVELFVPGGMSCHDFGY